MPDDVQAVWHGVNDAENLAELLSSTITWGECDVRRHPLGHLAVRHDPFGCSPEVIDDPDFSFKTVVEAFAAHGRSLKVDFKDGGPVVEDVLALVDGYGLGDDRLWFNAELPVLGLNGFHSLRTHRPGAILQCPIDFLAPRVLATPRQARAVLGTLAGSGIDRFSVRWGQRRTIPVLRRLQRWGYDVNLYGMRDHRSFYEAVHARPCSVTADFNFPAWDCFGRGSGAGGTYHPSRIRALADPVGLRSA